jgi:hypothetical protein
MINRSDLLALLFGAGVVAAIYALEVIIIISCIHLILDATTPPIFKAICSIMFVIWGMIAIGRDILISL